MIEIITFIHEFTKTRGLKIIDKQRGIHGKRLENMGKYRKTHGEKNYEWRFVAG